MSIYLCTLVFSHSCCWNYERALQIAFTYGIFSRTYRQTDSRCLFRTHHPSSSSLPWESDFYSDFYTRTSVLVIACICEYGALLACCLRLSPLVLHTYSHSPYKKLDLGVVVVVVAVASSPPTTWLSQKIILFVIGGRKNPSFSLYPTEHFPFFHSKSVDQQILRRSELLIIGFGGTDLVKYLVVYLTVCSECPSHFVSSAFLSHSLRATLPTVSPIQSL